MTLKSVLLSTAGVMLAAVSSPAAIAQDRVFVLEEVIVTAQISMLRKKDVPIAVTALSADFLTNNDVQTVEVLRGPQGTLYGRNSTSGAVLIQPARPTDGLRIMVNDFEVALLGKNVFDNRHVTQVTALG